MQKHLQTGSKTFARRARAVLLFGVAMVTLQFPASADISRGFLTLPDAKGSSRGKDHPGSIVSEAHDWNNGAGRAVAAGVMGTASKGPSGARPGQSGRLIVMVDAKGRDAALLTKYCTTKTPIAEAKFAEKSRGLAGEPDYWQYRLHKLKVTECPVDKAAVARAFTLVYEDAEWLNFDSKAPSPVVAPSTKIWPAPTMPGKSIKSFVITWLGIATDAEPDQCPVMNVKPGDADFFRYKLPDEIARIKAANGEKGVTAGAQSEKRGPGDMNVVLLPAVVPDPGQREPVTRIAYGMDLDGDGGKRAGKGALANRVNYRSPDGRPGIDNQLQKVMGCIPGYRGKSGYRNQTDNARRADGNIVTIVEISNIDDPQNDDMVEVAFIHAQDKPVRDVAGKSFIPDYSFRATADPAFARWNIRVQGRIVNGVVMTSPAAVFPVYSGQGPAYYLHEAQLRFEPLADGSLKGYLGGFQDWRYYAYFRASGYSEGLFNYNMPAVYYALKRNADGMKNPVTGKFDGISTVYELDTVTAFLVPSEKEASH